MEAGYMSNRSERINLTHHCIENNQVVWLLWVLTAANKLLPDGTRTSDYGESPHGLAIFTADGYYAVEIYRALEARATSGSPILIIRPSLHRSFP
jgi:Lipocalin-like domain